MSNTDASNSANISSTGEKMSSAAICFCTAQLWLNKLGYRYTNIKKSVFLAGHERSDVVEDRHHFLSELEKLSPYLVEFQKDGSMVSKKHLANCAVNRPHCQLCILITHNKSMFSANDKRHQVWLKEKHTFLRPKSKGKRIIISDFLLPWKCFNLFYLNEKERKVLKIAGVPDEAAEIFGYGQEERYWDGAKVVSQVWDKALPIVKALYPGYQAIFMFYNTKSHNIFAKNVLLINQISKGTGNIQLFLCQGWYEKKQHKILTFNVVFWVQ